jgi:hypothetical protein
MIEFLFFLHILFFVFSFAFTAGLSIFADRLTRTADAKTIHAVYSAILPLSIAGGVGWILTGVVGAALAGAYGMDMTAPWLLGTYVVFAVLLLDGFLLHLPWQRKVIAASVSPGPELEGLLHAPTHRVASGVSAVSILILVYLMTARPG